MQAFVPASLPPTPPIEWSSRLQEKFDQALLALDRLDSVSVLLPDTSLFLYMYVRKEAVLSSMIEGTQSSLDDLLLFEFKHQPGVPLDDVQECMEKLELFLHNQPEKTSVLAKAALAHVQFETIHPFLDGNGRLGRLLITLLLCSEKVLKEPMLYLSLYFKTHRQQYYKLLNEVRLTGDWEAWLHFFADAVIHTTTQAVDTAQQLMKLSEIAM